jgi:DNA-binding MurR/RpiR family transcriptional regulator
MSATLRVKSEQRPDRPDDGSLMDRLSRADLSAVERRLIETLFSLAEYDLATLTVAELAGKAGASRATIDRLAHRFGYAGQRDLRHALLRESRAMKAGVDEMESPGSEIVASDGPLEIAYKIFSNASVRALKFAELLSQTGELEQLVSDIYEARHIRIFGAGASAVVGLDMHQRLLRLGLQIDFAQDAHTQMAQAALMKPGDLAIGISFSGLTRTTVETASTAKERGAKLVAIVAEAHSPLAQLADTLILTPPGVGLFGTDAVMTRILQMMFNEVVFHCLAVRDGTLLENVRMIDRALNAEKIGPEKMGAGVLAGRKEKKT